MKRLEFEDFEDFACEVADTYDSNKDYDDVAIIAKYEEARKIIKELLCIGYDIHSLEIHDELWDNYDAEYVITVYDNNIWCEQMLRGNRYIDEESPVIYVLDNCSSKVIPHCKGKFIYEVTVGIEDNECECEDNECECEDCYECACNKDEKPVTTSTTSKSVTYKINNKEVSKEEFDKKYEEFEEMYLDNIREMLLNYCSFMDEMNDWRSRLLRW